MESNIGFILITTTPQAETNIYRKLREIQEVEDVHPLFGEYDIIVKIKAKDFEHIGKVIVEKIRTLEGIIDTKTLTGINF